MPSELLLAIVGGVSGIVGAILGAVYDFRSS